MKRLLTIFSAALLLGSAAISHAQYSGLDPYYVKGNTADLETYARLFGGVTFDGRFRNLEGIGGVSGVSINKVGLTSTVLYGGKLGVFPWRPLGLEVEAFTSTPHSKQQQGITFTAPGASVSTTLPGLHNRVTVLAFNLIGRYPGKRFQPYIGMGPAIFFASAKNGGATSSDTALGFNAQAGLNVRLGQRWGVFGEYKYNWARLHFDNIANLPPINQIGLTGIYSNNAIVAGVSWYF
jgi:opacity protein-like surface antigen